MYIVTAISLGLVGSLHCVGMCGPLMLAAAGGAGSGGTRSVFAYQAGRILTYAFLGLLFGGLGAGVELLGFQRHLAVGSGFLLLIVFLLRIDVERHLAKLPLLARWHFFLRSGIGKSLNNSGLQSRFFIGVLNGFLPCGLVYLAVIGAINAGGGAAGALFMAAFGAGTLPLLLITLWAGKRLALSGRKWFAVLTQLITLVAAVLLLWRGFQFQVPAEFWGFHALASPPMCH